MTPIPQRGYCTACPHFKPDPERETIGRCQQTGWKVDALAQCRIRPKRGRRA